MKTAFTPHDEAFMRQALRLAARARGDVEPNPLVGALVVRRGRIVGRGYHRRFGEAHAEVHALRAAGPAARGATLYVTLEPCCHWGKTPPCTDAILAAGIRRVVCAMIDPFARVHGRGARLLRRHGVQVDVGLLEEQSRRLNAPFLRRVGQGRPWVIAKWAQTLDGCIATASGESRWISSETSRDWVHILRGRMDAILVGLGTVLADDPLLMARPPHGHDIHRLATRIVLDSRCRLPLASQLLRTVAHAPLMIVHAAFLDRAASRRAQRLADRGAMLLPIPADRAGRPSLSRLLHWLGRHDYSNILLEGGPDLLASFLHARLVDEAHIFIAPRLIGGPHARRAVGGPDLLHLADAFPLPFASVAASGPDLHITAFPFAGDH